MAEQEMLPVEQCDRLYAADHEIGHHGLPEFYRERILAGDWDNTATVQAFVRNRLAATKAADERVRARIGEIMEDGGGFWRACSGRQEDVDGCVSSTDYPYSQVFRCHPGSGCSECGGIGVIWDDYDYDADARAALAEAGGG